MPSPQIYHLTRDQDTRDEEYQEDTKLTEKQQNLVQKHIGSLRTSLDPNKQLEPIETVVNVGYRFRLLLETARSVATDPERVIVNPYQLEISSGDLVVLGEEARIIRLERLETRILEILMRSAGVMRSRAWLHERVYGAYDMTPLSELDKRLLTLRKKINRDETGPLRTLPDTGFYCFSASTASPAEREE